MLPSMLPSKSHPMLLLMLPPPRCYTPMLPAMLPPVLPPQVVYIHAVRSRDDITFRQDTTPADHVTIVDKVHDPGVTMRVGFMTSNNKTTGVNRGDTGNPTVH